MSEEYAVESTPLMYGAFEIDTKEELQEIVDRVGFELENGIEDQEALHLVQDVSWGLVEDVVIVIGDEGNGEFCRHIGFPVNLGDPLDKLDKMAGELQSRLGIEDCDPIISMIVVEM